EGPRDIEARLGDIPREIALGPIQVARDLPLFRFQTPLLDVFVERRVYELTLESLRMLGWHLIAQRFVAIQVRAGIPFESKPRSSWRSLSSSNRDCIVARAAVCSLDNFSPRNAESISF